MDFDSAGSEFITINRILEHLKRVFGDSPIKNQPPRPSDFKGVKVSIEKAINVLKWKPKHGFQEGLKKN